MTLSSENLQQLKNCFTTMPIVKAYLFGSYARQEATENSDIDILVELDYQKGIGFAFIEMQNYFDEHFPKKVDLVSSKGLSPYILPIIEKEKQLIYER
jgi:uncharacterized protein